MLFPFIEGIGKIAMRTLAQTKAIIQAIKSPSLPKVVDNSILKKLSS